MFSRPTPRAVSDPVACNHLLSQTTRRRVTMFALASLAAVLSPSTPPEPIPVSTAETDSAGPMIEGCPSLPPDHILNTRVDHLPVHPRSNDYISSIGSEKQLKMDFGSGTWKGGPIGIPYTTVSGDQPKVPIHFVSTSTRPSYAHESDPGPYPIPPDAPIQGGDGSDNTGDRHVLVLDRDNCVLYELYKTNVDADGSWWAMSGAVFNLRSNALRPAGWTSANAAGLPILPGLVRYDELVSGEVRHALYFTAQRIQRAYVWPARHRNATDSANPLVPPMGTRVRLKASKDISGFGRTSQVILRALKIYGMVLVDNGEDWYVSGVPDPHWSNLRLRQLSANVEGSDFEVVDVSSLMVESDSGQAAINR
jgi:hypothetical protein